MQGIEEVEISRQSHGRLNIVREAGRCEIGEPNIRQETVGKARAVTLRIVGDDGNAHVERIAGRPAARPRKGVERDIHIEIAQHIVLRRAFKLHAAHIKAEPPQPLVGRLHDSRFRIGIVFEEKPRLRHTFHNLLPRTQHGVTEFLILVEGGELDIAAPPRRRPRRSREVRIPIIAELTRQAQEFFHIERLAAASLGVAAVVRHEVVHRPEPRRRHIAKPRELDGCRLPCEGGKPCARRMSRKIEQDVHLIRMDLPRNPLHIPRMR